MRITITEFKELVRRIVHEQFEQNVLPTTMNFASKQTELGTELDLIPPEVKERLSAVADAYINGTAKMYSVQKVFEDVLYWVDDPMEVVGIVYNELNKAAAGNNAIPSDRQKQKAQKAYDALINFAHQERMLKKYGL